MIRRLERLETDLLIERHARVDDLGLLVDLITAQWQGLNERLDRIEAALDHAGGRRAAPPRTPARRRYGPPARPAGRTSSKRDPRPGSESSSIVPPSACESSRAIARPRPVPP